MDVIDAILAFARLFADSTVLDVNLLDDILQCGNDNGMLNGWSFN